MPPYDDEEGRPCRYYDIIGGGKEGEVRQSEERSDEPTASTLAPKNTPAATSVRGTSPQ